MTIYYIKDMYGDYVGKGSYIVQGEPYKVIGSKDLAQKFKSMNSAKNELQRLKSRYTNIDDTCFIFEEVM